VDFRKISQNYVELLFSGFRVILQNLMPLPAANKNSVGNSVPTEFRGHSIPHMVRCSETVHVWKDL
jgi:hypothetical protein